MSKREDELNLFVRESLAKGATRAAIKKALLDAGWAAEHANSALAAYSDVEFSVPVPAPKLHISAGEAFLYLVLFTALYAAAYALGSLAFRIIEEIFPDPVRYIYDADKSIRWSISTLVVTAPIFLFAAHRVRRMLADDPAKTVSPVRKWLTYVALFIAAVFFIGDMVTLVFWFLGGELTVRVVLKVATVAIISGAIFGYYLAELRRDEQNQ